MLEIKTTDNFDVQIEAPSSKAYTLRALFIASLADGKSIIKKALFADDQKYAINALKQFGVHFKLKNDAIIVEGTNGNLALPEKDVFIGNSAVTARLLTTFSSLVPQGKTKITGSERMQTGRPIQDLLGALKPLGVSAYSAGNNGHLPVVVKGGSFYGGKTKLKGDKSSQSFSSILLSAPYAKTDVIVESIGELKSRPYIDMTLDSMKSFGVFGRNKDSAYKEFTVKVQNYRATCYTVEGDFSNAAYFFAAAAITGSTVKMTNLDMSSAQGDKKFIDFLEEMGCSVKKGSKRIIVEGGELKAIEKDMKDYPDIVQPMAIVAAFAKGRSKFINIGHLKYKECDRLKCTAAELRKIGINAVSTGDSLIVDGGNPRGAEIETYNDHRMAMSFAVAGLMVPGIKIKNPEVVNKSFPDFFDKLKEFY